MSLNNIGFSGQSKDTDREILLKMSDKDLLSACNTNRNMFFKVCDDQFFKRLLEQRYPDTINLFEGNYKQKYLQTVKWVAILQEKYNYIYTGENPETQYMVLQQNSSLDNRILVAVSTGQLSLVKYLLIDIKDDDYIARQNNFLVRIASKNGHLDLVKYFLSLGANIHAADDFALKQARIKGHTDVVEYIESLP